MAYDKFLIGYNDNNSGFQSNVKPWLINDNAFETLENVYVLRGRVRKKFGTILMGADQKSSRFRVLLGATDGSGDYSGTVPGVVFAVGQMFSVADAIFTVYQTGTPGNCLSTSVATCTYDTSTGTVTITGADVTTGVYFYPSTPVMGLTQFFVESSGDTNNIGFDTQFAYQFDRSNLAWERLDAGDSIWTGTDYQFFWSTLYQSIVSSLDTLWTTNFNTTDGIRYWNNATWTKPVINYSKGSVIDTTDGSGSASGTLTGTFFIGQVFTIGLTAFTVTASSGDLTPSSYSTDGPTGMGTFDIGTGAYTFTGAFPDTSIFFTGNNYIKTAKIIIQFKNRLLFLNTIELVNGVSQSFPYRVRWSAFNDPFSSPSFFGGSGGPGGFADASSSESIVTAQFVKDRLIVYFDASTFELVFTNNQVQPFIWQKINNELGAVSTFSEIPFDKVTLGIDDDGIHACNGANVERIDTKIPQYPFGISNEEHGQDRVSGIRDYYNEMAYWTICPTDRNDSFYFPNQVLCYNYVNESWSTLNDSFTTFGYYFMPSTTDGLTWGSTITQWGNNIRQWNSSVSTTSNSTIKTIIAGNQQGFVQILQTDITSEAQSLQITNFTVTGSGMATVSSINHNLQLDQFVLFTNMNGLTFTDSNGNLLDSLMARVNSDTINNETPDSFTISSLDNVSQPIIITGTYTGGGNACMVSNIDILSKQYNFYTSQDRNMYLSTVDFMVDRTDIGEVTVDYLTSSAPLSLVSQGLGTVASPGPLPGNSTLQTSPYALSNFERFQTRLWHPVYLYAEGECVQLNLYLTPNQMYSYQINCDSTISYVALQDFQMHAMVFYVTPTSYRMR